MSGLHTHTLLPNEYPPASSYTPLATSHHTACPFRIVHTSAAVIGNLPLLCVDYRRCLYKFGVGPSALFGALHRLIDLTPCPISSLSTFITTTVHAEHGKPFPPHHSLLVATAAVSLAAPDHRFRRPKSKAHYTTTLVTSNHVQLQRPRQRPARRSLR